MYALIALLAIPCVFGQVDEAARPTPSCERLPYKKICDDLNVPSQFTLRYYVKDGKCCSYPFGWCPADETNLQAAIRTKEDCEAFCLRGEPANPTGPGGSGGHGGSGSASQGTGTGAGGNGGGPGYDGGRGGNGGSGSQAGGRGGNGGNGGRGGSGGSGTFGQDTSKPPVKTCDRQPYKDFCEVTRTPSQFTLRWYLRDGMCCSYPWGFCPGDELAFETSLRTKEECEELCLGKAPSGGSGHGGSSSSGGHGGSGDSGSGSLGSGSGSGGSGSGSSGSGSGSSGSGSGSGGSSSGGPGYQGGPGTSSGGSSSGGAPGPAPQEYNNGAPAPAPQNYKQ